MSDSCESTDPAAIAAFVGKHYIYTYENGWQYEFYIRNERTIEYRVHGGLVGGRWVKHQPAHIVRLADGVFKVSWDEPTGTSVSVAVNLAERRVHGATFFPQWIVQQPQKIVCFQNEHLDLMRRYRDEGPTYPRVLIDEFATITFLEDRGRDDDTVIACAPDALPPGYTARRN